MDVGLTDLRILLDGTLIDRSRVDLDTVGSSWDDISMSGPDIDRAENALLNPYENRTFVREHWPCDMDPNVCCNITVTRVAMFNHAIRKAWTFPG